MGEALGYNAGVPSPRRPKLGQHFLTTKSYRQRIVQALPLQADDLVVEIGPGRGAMTELLAQRARAVVAVELDGLLAKALAQTLQPSARIEIIHADILSTDLAALCRGREVGQCFVFGNLPYYITSPIIHHLVSYAAVIRAMALLVQREVAARIVAQPGSREYGYLSVLAQFYSKPRLAFVVPPGAFSPPPKVQSALVNFQTRLKFSDWAADDPAHFLEFVKRCFAQKRKNLLNNLMASFPRTRIIQALDSQDLPPSVRAEEMAVDQLADLWRGLV